MGRIVHEPIYYCRGCQQQEGKLVMRPHQDAQKAFWGHKVPLSHDDPKTGRWCAGSMLEAGIMWNDWKNK